MLSKESASFLKVVGNVVRDYVTAQTSGLKARILALEDRKALVGERGETGPPGVGIVALDVGVEGELLAELTDGRTVNFGTLRHGKDGTPGEKGTDGIPGTAGKEGRDGIDGGIGPIGPAGEKGLDGTPGRDGIDGKDGAPGEKGIDGRDGIAGADGAPGPKGDPGDVGPAGPMGPPGPAGVPGPIGAKGLDGERGEKGLQGDLGPQGIAGRDGLPGVQGPQGKGIDGANGKDGRDGIDGKDALGFDDIVVEHDGERGFTFKFVRGEQVKTFGTFTIPAQIYRGVYEAGKSYAHGDLVTWGGSQWHAKEATTAKPGEANAASRAWQLAVKRGSDGKSGVNGKDGRDGKGAL